MTKSLFDLVSALPRALIASVRGDLSVPVTAPVVESDAEVEPGGIFIARLGQNVDGHDFIPAALKRGAVAIVGEDDLIDLNAPYVRVHNAQEATGYLAAAFHDFPSRRLIVIGVTGTDGKTTTSTLIHAILNHASGGRAGLISTIKADLGSTTADTGLHVTTPGAPRIQALLAQMVANGLQYAVLEVTSHGLAQGRVNGIEFDAAVLTNITHEHLDFHGTFENYRAAKGRLFEMLTRSARKNGLKKISVINADDANADYFASYAVDRLILYGLGELAEYRAVDIRYTPQGTSFRVEYPDDYTFGTTISEVEFQTRLLGPFNVYNALAAVEVCIALPFSTRQVEEGLKRVETIPGRMEPINEGQPYTAVVDFAHTPNALKHALMAARAMTAGSGQVIAVFGSAGLRDREKRALMGEIGAELADFSIFTAEDPRTESLDDILKVMAEAARRRGGIPGQTFIRVPDRGEALLRACQMAKAGDVVIACGKGHEQSMCFGTVEYPWDDREALRAAIRGIPLRTLPTAPV
jgi:UDP-N-acetylmuramoyl-L-alanyl-D-glutamate--2,6-diaminopimelate ligase